MRVYNYNIGSHTRSIYDHKYFTFDFLRINDQLLAVLDFRMLKIWNYKKGKCVSVFRPEETFVKAFKESLLNFHKLFS